MDSPRALAFRIGVGALGRLPPAGAYALADALAPLVAAASLLRERRVARRGRGQRRNERIVYREAWSPARGRRLRLASARHLTRLAVDFARTARLDAEGLRRCVDLDELEPLRRLHAEGRGLICVTGHLGVWELCARVPGLAGVPITTVARPARDPGLAEAVRALRSSGEHRVLVQRGALGPLLRCLRRGEAIGLLADEDVARRPIFAPFLGTLAATSRVPALLQRRTGAPIAVVSCPRIGRARYRLRCWRVIRASRDADPLALTAAVNDALSEAIRASPEQWLWGSRRFATRPPDEKPDPDGLPPRAPAGLLAPDAPNARPRKRAQREQARAQRAGGERSQ